MEEKLKHLKFFAVSSLIHLTFNEARELLKKTR
jgi:hypothetical protein